MVLALLPDVLSLPAAFPASAPPIASHKHTDYFNPAQSVRAGQPRPVQSAGARSLDFRRPGATLVALCCSTRLLPPSGGLWLTERATSECSSSSASKGSASHG